MKGIYCSHCGEKIVSDKKELGLVFFLKDAFEEVFSVDSKFLRTIRLLLTKPGFLTNEVIAGRKVPYIKPFRLYTIVVVLHFLVFSLSGSGDVFTVDRFPIFQMIPGFHTTIEQYELKSGLSHESFNDLLNEKLKANLNILFYFVVFVLALYLKLLYLKQGKYYVEHLYYSLHMISFGLLRNIALIPLLVFGWYGPAVIFSIMTQLPYTFISMSKVYKDGSVATVAKVFLVIIGFMLVLIPTLFLSLVLGIIQILA